MELENLIAPDRLLGLQETYTGPLGVAGSIVAPGGRRITPESNRRRLCSLLCRSDHFRRCCRDNDQAAGDAAESGVTIYRTECCGLTDVAIPLSIESRRAATLLFGLVRTGPSSPEEVAELVDGYLARAPELADRDALEDALAAVPVVDPALLHASATLLRELADHIADLAARSMLEAELKRARRRARDADRAHSFLSATLNTLAALAIVEHADEAHALVVLLSRASRYAAEDQDVATVAEEIDHTRDYLAIRQAALGEGLQFDVHHRETTGVLLPRLSIRELVEDLLWRHLEAATGNPIRLIATRERGNAVIEIVADVAPGHPTNLAIAADLRERLRRIHGHGATLAVTTIGESLRARVSVEQGHN
jgi:ligand-binding sensor protein